ncbi:MAG: hemolysin family protein [Desulfobacterales bacterium]|nr:hemolysin family protein [Desulfobacterales bacterium]MDD3081537.1 hemolysin family protein [Desulfobacterales bacterium]MDD3950051.1 hemolysin family protein [Desulfobacterales bacterium]MDD4462879.1 hemolysin family protein [Desulfobacterales bacterium]MDY0377795.1 hemolysin family protein [Desulfobacterales bacterium]
MEVPLFFETSLILILLVVSGVFSGSETALFSLTLLKRERIRKRSETAAGFIEFLLTRPNRLITTILIGNDLVNIAASVLSASLFVSLYGGSGRWIAIAVMTPLTLIFAEVIPKTLFMAHNERIAPVVAGPLTVFQKFIAPVRWAFEKISNALIARAGLKRSDRSTALMEDDFLDMVDDSHLKGQLKASEKELIHNVFEFSDVRVVDVMTPFDRMVVLSDDIKAQEILSLVNETRHARIPVYSKNRRHIAGILYVKDLLKVDFKRTNPQARILPQLIRRPYFIPETKKADELFNILKQKRIHMAICLNDRQEVSGLVTMEDLLEELFGEIYDEYDEVPGEHTA